MKKEDIARHVAQGLRTVRERLWQWPPAEDALGMEILVENILPIDIVLMD